MLGLMYKDLLVYKKIIFFNLLVALFLNILQFILADEELNSDIDIKIAVVFCLFAFVMAFYAAGFFESSLYESDERKKWVYFIGSCPYGVWKNVGAKYLMVLIMSLSTAAICRIVNLYTLSKNNVLVDLKEMCIVFVAIQIVLRSLDIPFTIALGSKAGAKLRIIILSLIFFAFIVYLLFGDISNFNSVYDIIYVFIDPKHAKLKHITTVIKYIALPLFCGSYLISGKLYLKSADYLDK